MDTESTKRVSALVGLLSCTPVLSTVVQRVVRRECEAGHVEDMSKAMAQHLLDTGIAERTIPPNSGDRSAVENEAQARCLAVAQKYNDDGGALTGWFPVWRLASVMMRLWAQDFSAPIPVSRKLSAGLSEEEVSDRLCVAVLHSYHKLKDMAKSDDHQVIEIPDLRVTLGDSNVAGKTGYFIAKEDVEIVLSTLIKRALTSFDDPNTANHALVHGSSS